MSITNITRELRAYRRRAMEAQANNGTHAWDLTPGAWDSDSDAEAYCLDAVDSFPAGSTRMLPGMHAASRMMLREPYPCDAYPELRAAA